MIKKWKLAFILLVLPVVLAGCVQMDLHVKTNMDGSGVYEWKFLTDTYLQNYLQQAVTVYSNQGYQTKLIQEHGKVGFIATKPVNNIAAEPLSKEFGFNMNTSSLLLQQVASQNNSFYPMSYTQKAQDKLKIDSGFLSTSFLFHTNIDMTDALHNIAGNYTSYANSLLNQLKMRFLLTLPITPSQHNANAVADNGKTLIWNLKLGQPNPIQVGVDLPTPVVLAVAAANGQASSIPNFWGLTVGWILLVVAVIFLLTMLIRRLFGRKKPPSGGNQQIEQPFEWE